MQPGPVGVPVTTKQMLQQSTAFRLCFWGAVLLTIAVVVLGIVAGTTTCSGSHSCYWWYGSSYSEQCYSYSTYYCCRSGWSYCGDYNYCNTKPDEICWGVLIALWVCAGLSFILGVAVIILACNFRRRARNPLFNPALNYVQVQPYGYNPGYQQ
jgi:hypothetical protein